MTLKVLGNTVVDTALVYTINQANVSAGGNVNWDASIVADPGFQGIVSGYSSAGLIAPTQQAIAIDKFPFASDASAVGVGNLNKKRDGPFGQSSPVSGYASGGRFSNPPNVFTTDIDKFPFAFDVNTTAVGDLTQGRKTSASHSSLTFGYSAGGEAVPPVSVTNNIIDKFPFAADTNATDVGDLTQGRYAAAGQSSTTHGYSSGGYDNPPIAAVNTIDKFSFSSDGNATDVGDLSAISYGPTGQSSTTNGYASGGSSPGNNTIHKFPFATDTNATDIGDITQGRLNPAGQSSTVSGYTSGGVTPAPSFSNVIDKFPFSSDTNATDVGDLAQARRAPAGHQN